MNMVVELPKYLTLQKNWFACFKYCYTACEKKKQLSDDL